MTAALTLASTSPVSGANDGQIIGKNQITLTGDRLTPEALWAMGRIGTFAVSPDAQKIVYTVSYYSVQQNKSHTVLYLMDADGANPTLLTTTADNESEPAFTPDGQKITFLSGKSGSSQIWEMALDGTSRRQVSFCHKDVEGYKFSPDGKKVIIVHSVDTYTSIEKKYDDLPLSSGMVITDLNYKHWDRYVTTIPHIFVADVQDGRTGDGIDLLNGEPFECPMLPFGGSEQFNWSPDSRYIVYTSRKKTGRDYAISTDSDIYRYDTATGQTENLCKPADYKEPEIDPSRSMEHQTINHLDRDCNVGYDTNLNFELLAAMRPDLMLLYGVTGENTIVTGKLRELGIPYIYIGDYMEESPLGKAEWLVLAAELCDLRAAGADTLQRIARDYQALKAHPAPDAPRPKVMLNTPYRDTWFLPSSQSYMIRLIEDAGGEYVYTKNDSDTSVAVDMEEAYLLANAADFWLNVGPCNTLAELTAQNPKFSGIPVVRSRNVYNNNRRQTPAGGSDFWESGVVRPDLVLRDLRTIFLGDSVPTCYYKRLE